MFKLLVLTILFSFANGVFAAEESFSGKLSFNDSSPDDFDGDLEVSYDLKTTSSGTGSSKVYTGYTATFTGVTDGACFKLKLMLNQKLCAESTLDIQVPTSGSGGVLSLLQGGNISVGAADDDYLELLSDTEILFDNDSCSGRKMGGCFYNTPKIGTDGQCEALQECALCAGNTFTVTMLCQNGTSIPAEGYDNDAGGVDYSFPVEKLLALKEDDSGILINSETRVGNYFSVRNSSEDTPTICEGVNFVNEIMDDTEKSNVENGCGDPNSLACRRATRKSMSKVFNDMAGGTTKLSARNFFFKHSTVSSSRSKWMRDIESSDNAHGCQ